jgi:hypothetical protein
MIIYASVETALKNPNCHSERNEESHIFSSQKIERRDPSAFGLRVTRKGKFTKILEHSLRRLRNWVKARNSSPAAE